MRVATRFVSLLAVLTVAAVASAKEKPGKAVELFNGKNLEGWDYYLVDPDAKMEDVWSVEDGILICKGEPMGYLATEDKFENFKLVVEWRWAPGKEPGNSGVLLRVTGEPMALPKCVEAQLKHQDAGDIWAFQGFEIQGPEDRFKGGENDRLGKFSGISKIKGNENPPGQWNKYEIYLKGGKLKLVVNGEKVNAATGCEAGAGAIALQSEGGEIHFRTVKLVPLDK